MSDRILSDDGYTRYVEVSASYGYLHSSPAITQTIIGFEPHAVMLFELTSGEVSGRVTLTYEQLARLVELGQAYQRDQEETSANLEDHPF